MKLINIRFFKETIKLFVQILSGKYFYEFNLHPKRSCDFFESALLAKENKNDKIAIIIQGKVVRESNFTLETIKIYRMLFPYAEIILSTWPDAKNIADTLDSLKVHLLINDPPQNPGRGNLNYQLISTNGGLAKARDLGVIYVLKTRTDQRINHPSTLAYFSTLLRVFPLFEEDKKRLRGRIIGISRNTYKHRIFGLSDMLQFGYLEDVQKYWNVTELSEESQQKPQEHVITWRDQYLNPVPEVTIFNNFLNNILVRLEPTLKATAEVYARFIIIVNYRDIELYWNKYSFNHDWHRDFTLDRYELEFLDWLTHYAQRSNIDIDECFVDMAISGRRPLLEKNRVNYK